MTTERQLETEGSQSSPDSEAGKGARLLRVLHVSNINPANYYYNNLFTHTDRSLVEFSALTLGPADSFLEELSRRGIPGYALGCTSRSAYPRAIKALSRIIEDKGIDIVHTHLFEPTLLGLAAAKLRGRKVVVTRHHSDAIHTIPKWLKRRTYLALERTINRRADHLIAPSRMVRDILIEREGVPASKVSLIPYGQTTERFDAVTEDAINAVRGELGMGDNLALVCVSRLHKEKGHPFLFEAFKKLLGEGLDATLYLVGIGPDRERLEALAGEMGIESRVRFLGWRSDALAIIAAADVVVHPSLHEALPSAIIETVMLGKPLVVTDVSGIRDIVGESEYAAIVPPGDAESFRTALAQTISDLSGARARAELGRHYITEYMDAGRVAKEYLNCYYKVSGRAHESAGTGY